MFRNPLKYASGGVTSQEQQKAITVFENASKNTGIDVNTLAEGLNQLQDKKQKQALIQQIVLASQGDEQAINTLKQLFEEKTPVGMSKDGGKIQYFICKHGKGGKAGCGCKQEGGEINQYGPGGWLRNLFRRNPQGVRQVNVTGFDPDGSSSDPFYGSEMTETLPNAHQRRIRSNWWGVGQEPVRDTSIVTPAGKVSNSDENWKLENDAFDRAKYVELPGTTISDYVEQRNRLRNPGEMERGGKVEKHQQNNKGRGKIGRLGSLNYVEREYDPEGNAIYTMAQTRETLPSVMRSDPFSDYSQNGGEYQGDGQIRIVDFGNGRTRVIGNPYGPMNEDLWHGNDSVSALQHLRQLAPRAGIKLGPAIKEQNGGLAPKQRLSSRGLVYTPYKPYGNYIPNSLVQQPLDDYELNRFRENPYYKKQMVESVRGQVEPRDFWPLYNAFYGYPSPVTMSGEPLNNRVEGPQETLAGMKCGGKVKKK